jgi:hypothetical protein
VEAKKFSFSALAGKSELRLEERRKDFVGSLSLSLQCSDWLADMVEEASLSLGEEDFAKSFREKGKVLKVHKGGNKAGRFLVATAFAEGGRSGGIWFPEGRDGWGWRRIVGEMRKCLGFLAAEECPLVSSVNAGGGSFRDRSFAAETSSGLKSQPDVHLDLCPVMPWIELAKGGEEMRSPVNCAELETVAPLKKIDTGTEKGGGGDLRRGDSGRSDGGPSRLKMLRVSRAWKALLEKIRMDVDRVLSRLGLRPKYRGFRLRAGRRSGGPRLGPRPKCVGATLEPCVGLSSGVVGQIETQERARLGPGSAMGSGYPPSAMTSLTSPVTGLSSPVPSSEFELPVVAIAEVPSSTLDVAVAPVIIPLIPELADAVAMDSESPAVSVAEVVSPAASSLPLDPFSDLAMIPELSSVSPLVSDAGLEPMDVGDLGELSGSSPASARNSSLALIACDDPTPLQRWSVSQARMGTSLLSDPSLASNPAILEAFSIPGEDEVVASPGSSDWEDSDSGVADSVDLPASEVSLAAQNSFPAKSLIRRGFLGPRATHTVSDDALPSPPAMPATKGRSHLSGGAAELGRRLSQPGSSTSSVSKSQSGYARRVKEKVAKQLNKNKELLAEAIVVNPGEGVEGYSDKVLSLMKVAPVMGLTWGGDDKKMLDLLSARDKRERKVKGMRELKNLDCSLSPVKGQRRRGVVGSKNDISFPPKVH